MSEQETIYRPNTLELTDNLPVLCVIGAGLSGLLTAIEAKEQNTRLQVVVLEKPQPESNTQVSGMRIRAKRAASSAILPEDRIREVIDLLAGQNSASQTSPMAEFGQLLTAEMTIWNRRLSQVDPELVHELPEWFGPQWGKVNLSGRHGRGSSILNHLRQSAAERGIKFLHGEARALHKERETITSVDIGFEQSQYSFRPDAVVLANGNAAGSLFLSTNKSIRSSATELLFDAGLPLVGGSLIMWHPFGRCRDNGTPALGCYETDTLENTRVIFPDGTNDEETASLLRQHQAHYHFKEISRRFLEKGGVVRLVDANGKSGFARVSLHYSHLSALTLDGTQVEGMTNLAVVGDAGGLLHWTNYRTRLPGFALAHCLVSARKAADWASVNFSDDNSVLIESRRRMTSTPRTLRADPENNRPQLKQINTRHALALEFGDRFAKPGLLSSWAAELNQLGGDCLVPLSLAVMNSWIRVLHGEHEPISLTREG